MHSDCDRLGNVGLPSSIEYLASCLALVVGIEDEENDVANSLFVKLPCGDRQPLHGAPEACDSSQYVLVDDIRQMKLALRFPSVYLLKSHSPSRYRNLYLTIRGYWTKRYLQRRIQFRSVVK